MVSGIAFFTSILEDDIESQDQDKDIPVRSVLDSPRKDDSDSNE